MISPVRDPDIQNCLEALPLQASREIFRLQCSKASSHKLSITNYNDLNTEPSSHRTTTTRLKINLQHTTK